VELIWSILLAAVVTLLVKRLRKALRIDGLVAKLQARAHTWFIRQINKASQHRLETLPRLLGRRQWRTLLRKEQQFRRSIRENAPLVAMRLEPLLITLTGMTVDDVAVEIVRANSRMAKRLSLNESAMLLAVTTGFAFLGAVPHLVLLGYAYGPPGGSGPEYVAGRTVIVGAMVVLWWHVVWACHIIPEMQQRGLRGKSTFVAAPLIVVIYPAWLLVTSAVFAWWLLAPSSLTGMLTSARKGWVRDVVSSIILVLIVLLIVWFAGWPA